jgi:hypothetical protein
MRFKKKKASKPDKSSKPGLISQFATQEISCPGLTVMINSN